MITAKPLDTMALLSAASVEVSSRGNQLAELCDCFPPGINVTITFLPGDDYHHNIETAAALRQVGFNPFPHVAARGLSRAALDDFLTRARGEADVKRILLIGGDIAVPRGPFASTFDVLASGLIEAHGIETVSIAGHPEGHPHIDADEAFAAIRARRDWGRKTGVAVDIVSQFCFESGPILDWIKALESRGLDLPVTVGMAGPATPATLMKFALRCGIGNSLKALRGQIGRFGRLLVDTGPDDVVQGLSDAPPEATALVSAFHFFPLGGLRKTSKWLKTQRSR